MHLKKYVFLFVASMVFGVSLSQPLQRTEPPFWYAGMKNPELTVLFYGTDIASYQVTTANASLITGVQKTENPNYLFVKLNLSGISPSKIDFTFTAKGKKSFTQAYEIKARRKDSAIRKGFDSSDMIYLVMPDRFANGNPSNDNTADTSEKADRNNSHGRHGGDIQGIIDHLDYIKSLGATALWNTPLCEDNDSRGSYHGYAQSDVYKIDPRYGTNDDYLKLSAELHKRGMKLILDYVTNHWGDQHWMYKDLPTYEWVHQFPGYAQSNYRMTTQFDTNASERDRKYCVDGWFVRSMPDLDQSNPLVLNYLTQNAIWWIEYADLDGYRVDTYSYNDKEGIAKWTKAILDEYPYFNITGEVWMHDQAQMAYWQRDSKIGAIQGYNSNLPTVMDFTLHDAISQMLKEEANWDKGMIRAYDNFANDFLYPDINNILVFAENHDTQRFNHIYESSADYKLAMALIATIRGIPQLYYGSEIGMAGNKDKGDGDIRRDFPGGWKGDATNAFTDAGRSATQKDYFDYTAKLFNWRKTKKVIHSGKTTQFIPEKNVYVYFRYDDADTVMVVLNASGEKQTMDLSRYTERIGTKKSGKDVVSGQTIGLEKALEIPAKTAYVLELQ